METHNRDLGTAMEVEPDGAVRVKRVTRESDIELKLDPNRWEAAETETGLAFFDHMLEMLAWHASMTLEVRFDNRRMPLNHLVTEDVGIVLGRAVAEVLAGRATGGVRSVGEATRAMDRPWLRQSSASRAAQTTSLSWISLGARSGWRTCSRRTSKLFSRASPRAAEEASTSTFTGARIPTTCGRRRSGPSAGRYGIASRPTHGWPGAPRE